MTEQKLHQLPLDYYFLLSAKEANSFSQLHVDMRHRISERWNELHSENPDTPYSLKEMLKIIKLDDRKLDAEEMNKYHVH